jgi:CheY-like chemotaxis protein
MVLLVEDNPMDAYMIENTLKSTGLPLNIITATDSGEAMDVFKQFERSGQGLALIVLDWKLPSNSGEELLTYARQSKACGDVPILVASSSSSPSEIREMMKHGATAYFPKASDYDEYSDLKRLVLKLLKVERSTP